MDQWKVEGIKNVQVLVSLSSHEKVDDKTSFFSWTVTRTLADVSEGRNVGADYSSILDDSSTELDQINNRWDDSSDYDVTADPLVSQWIGGMFEEEEVDSDRLVMDQWWFWKMLNFKVSDVFILHLCLLQRLRNKD